MIYLNNKQFNVYVGGGSTPTPPTPTGKNDLLLRLAANYRIEGNTIIAEMFSTITAAEFLQRQPGYIVVSGSEDTQIFASECTQQDYEVNTDVYENGNAIYFKYLLTVKYVVGQDLSFKKVMFYFRSTYMALSSNFAFPNYNDIDKTLLNIQTETNHTYNIEKTEDSIKWPTYEFFGCPIVTFEYPSYLYTYKEFRLTNFMVNGEPWTDIIAFAIYKIDKDGNISKEYDDTCGFDGEKYIVNTGSNWWVEGSDMGYMITVAPFKWEEKDTNFTCNVELINTEYQPVFFNGQLPYDGDNFTQSWIKASFVNTMYGSWGVMEAIKDYHNVNITEMRYQCYYGNSDIDINWINDSASDPAWIELYTNPEHTEYIRYTRNYSN